MIAKKELLSLYEKMIRIRLVEEAVADCYKKKEISMYIHLYVGQEAIASAICTNLNKDDFVYSNHRSHGHYIAQGGNLKAFFAELFGRQTGCSSGKGGSMHLIDLGVGYMGSSSIVGGNIPIAVGTGLALKLKHSKNIAVSFFGDGACDEGVLYESLNFAALKKLPVFFVCENNFYAICSHQSKRQALDNIYKKARVFGVPAERVDGNDGMKLYLKVKNIVRGIREGNGPYFLECRTYRWMGHAGPSSDDSLAYRSKADIEYWKKRCPIRRLEDYLFKKKILTESQRAGFIQKINKQIQEALEFARKSPFPGISQLNKDIFSQKRIVLCQ